LFAIPAADFFSRSLVLAAGVLLLLLLPLVMPCRMAFCSREDKGV